MQVWSRVRSRSLEWRWRPSRRRTPTTPCAGAPDGRRLAVPQPGQRRLRRRRTTTSTSGWTSPSSSDQQRGRDHHAARRAPRPSRPRTTGAPLSSYSLDFQGSSEHPRRQHPQRRRRDRQRCGRDLHPDREHHHQQRHHRQAQARRHAGHPGRAARSRRSSPTTAPRSSTPTPTARSRAGTTPTDGATFLNQPVGAMTLFPNNNTPRDKATYTFTIDAPTLSERPTSPRAAATATRSAWSATASCSRRPVETAPAPPGCGTRPSRMASELSMFSVGRYDIYESDIT